MNNKFAVVIVYFGQFKNSISLFLSSCIRNPDVDWLFFLEWMKIHNRRYAFSVSGIQNTLKFMNIRNKCRDMGFAVLD